MQGVTSYAILSSFLHVCIFLADSGVTINIISGDTIYLKAHTGKNIDVEGTSVQARWENQGGWQALVIEKATSGIISSGDTVYLKAHTGENLDVEGTTVQARWEDKGGWQALVIEKATSGIISSGDTIYLKAHTGKNIDVEGTTVQARWEGKGGWQALVIAKATNQEVCNETAHAVAPEGSDEGAPAR